MKRCKFCEYGKQYVNCLDDYCNYSFLRCLVGYCIRKFKELVAKEREGNGKIH